MEPTWTARRGRRGDEEATARMSLRAWDSVKGVARREQITLSAVIHRYPALLPKRLQNLAATCFVRTHDEWIEARLLELRKIIRVLEADRANRLEKTR